MSFPSESELAALRAVHEGIDSATAVRRYLAGSLQPGQSARRVLGGIRRRLVTAAQQRQRDDLIAILRGAGWPERGSPRRLQQAIEALRATPAPTPRIADPVARWFSARVVRALHAHDIRTLAHLTVRIPRLRGWWRSIPGLGRASAERVEAFFQSHHTLTEQARALVVRDESSLAPWERLRVPADLDGSRGAFRAPAHSCVLAASNDYEAVNAWLSLHESATTQRAYRKEAERLILWSIIERGKALSSLTTEDAIAYRAFLRRPTPKHRWIGAAAPRKSPDWRPFQRGLSPRSAAYALTVIGAMFRWLIEQRYVLANPFAGVRVKSGSNAKLDTSRAFAEHEWTLVLMQARALEDVYGWSTAAADRLLFVLEFAHATGLRLHELVGATLGDLHQDEKSGAWWLAVIGKGGKQGLVAVPPQARLALDRYLARRGISTIARLWDRKAPLIASVQEDAAGVTPSRLWAVSKRFFLQASDRLRPVNQALADKLQRASPHWLRHTHASMALERGASLTTVRDNLRHASLATTSIYLHTDAARRAREMAAAFTDGSRSRRGVARAKA